MSISELKNIEMIRFEVSKKQLIGEPQNSPMGGKLQNILFADGWYLVRPVEKLHETENGKIAFSLAKNKRDGSVNEITLKRSRRLEGTDEHGRPLFKQEKMTVSIEELKDIEKYGKEKYRYQKETEKNQVKKDNKGTEREQKEFYGMMTFVSLMSEKEEDNFYSFYDDETLFNGDVAYQKQKGSPNYGTVLTRQQFIENIAKALETNGHYMAIGASLRGDYTAEVAEWKEKHPASVAIEPGLAEINQKVSKVHDWEAAHPMDVKDGYATRMDGRTGQILVLSDKLLNMRYKQIEDEREQMKERFVVVETENAQEPFAILDRETKKLLQSEDEAPCRFYVKNVAESFAKDANTLAKDGLYIRCLPNKAYALCKIAVHQNGLALAFIKNQTLELALDAVRQNPNAIVAVNDKYRDEIANQMPEMLFDKMLRGEVAQNEVIRHLLALDNKADYSVFVVKEDGMRHEIKAGGISSGVTKLTDEIHSYTAFSGEKWIHFNDKNIEKVQYKGLVAASYDANKDPLVKEAGIRPRSRVR